MKPRGTEGLVKGHTANPDWSDACLLLGLSHNQRCRDSPSIRPAGQQGWTEQGCGSERGTGDFALCGVAGWGLSRIHQ